MSETQSTQNLVPRIRFKGFADAWEQCKLGNVVNRVTRKNKKLESSLPLTISAQYGLIDQRIFFNKTVASKDISGYFLVMNGEFAYNKSYSKNYPLGTIKRLDNYDMGVLSTLYIVFKPEHVDSDFLAAYYESTTWHREVSAVATEGARNHGLLNISPNDFFNTNITLPTLEKEQQKVGAIIKLIDALIASNQRKGEILRAFKKVILNKMFVSKGATTPEIRFAGFDYKWKRRKYKDISDRLEYGLNASAKKYDGIHKYLRITDIDDTSRKFLAAHLTSPDISFDNDNNDKYQLKAGDLLLARTGTSTGKSYLYNPNDGVVYFAGFLIRMSLTANVSPSFIYQTTLTTSFKNFINVFSQRSGQPGINANEYGNYAIHVPYIKEQQKIGKLFNNINELITTNQRKVEILKDLKKSLLQTMLI